ncbi:hypothetical protein BU24DRAFT_485457 [Aaosphaeria arxii CBS 175.79]|uniref:Uncharacterized protein n=1 Tax=Aaosphaeria arxii CBS 175.79 TaxID=1450172 RepID=A0A6A5XIG5_9PLEO|nr:uncharacterized protein BU24DRAFT_485457 [Aaosphaeria arxii CBS 175.79]KAF2012104.1 hypothetical protein BU24DRAFT_485457 [Aaosphaeria arxii CBS 175.79]
MSSHRAACLAAARALAREFSTFDILKGIIFDAEDATGRVCCGDSAFFVDHGEPLEVLAQVRDTKKWPLAELFDGDELLFGATLPYHSWPDRTR